MARFLEVRRHSYTKKGAERGSGSHLSREGVTVARRIGAGMGPFARVYISDVPRTLETAIAMGFAVDDVLPFGEALDWDAVVAEIGWHSLWNVTDPFDHIAANLPTWPQTSRMGKYYAEAWTRITRSLSSGESALVISHGQLMEVALVSALPSADRSLWGSCFSHCEGFRLRMGADEFESVEVVRVQANRPAI